MLIKANDYNNTDHKKLETYINNMENTKWNELLVYKKENKLSYFFIQTVISYLKYMLNRVIKPYYKKY